MANIKARHTAVRTDRRVKNKGRSLARSSVAQVSVPHSAHFSGDYRERNVICLFSCFFAPLARLKILFGSLFLWLLGIYARQCSNGGGWFITYTLRPKAALESRALCLHPVDSTFARSTLRPPS